MITTILLILINKGTMQYCQLYSISGCNLLFFENVFVPTCSSFLFQLLAAFLLINCNGKIGYQSQWLTWQCLNLMKNTNPSNAKCLNLAGLALKLGTDCLHQSYNSEHVKCLKVKHIHHSSFISSKHTLKIWWLLSCFLGCILYCKLLACLIALLIACILAICLLSLLIPWLLVFLHFACLLSHFLLTSFLAIYLLASSITSIQVLCLSAFLLSICLLICLNSYS